jgi:hypothetical protein
MMNVYKLKATIAGLLILASANSGSVLAQVLKSDASANDTWHVIGLNKDRIATGWVQLKSYEVLNENSFRMNAKFSNNNGVQIVGRIDVNCKNKDYYFRPNGIMVQMAPWAAIPEGSGVHGLAMNYCKNTSARAEWGYRPETAYLWDAPLICPTSRSALPITPSGAVFFDKGLLHLLRHPKPNQGFIRVVFSIKDCHLLRKPMFTGLWDPTI